MSTARSADAETAPAAVAAALADAPFVRVVARADGDSLAASGILARALRSAEIPFHVQLRPNPTPESAATVTDDTVVSVGATAAALAVPGDDSPASLAAYRVASELGDTPDPTLALAGVVAGEGRLDDDAYDSIRSAAEAAGVTRRPGVGVPVADLADGLAHSTLLCAPFSGDVESARATLAEATLPTDLDDDAHRCVASVVALDATAKGTTPRAVESLERVLRPYETPDGAFETVEGYADVLCAVARERPGTGVALALGHATDATRTAALDAWRNHALEAHTVLREAETARYADCFVVRTGLGSESLGVLATTARLVRDFRSPEPVVLAVGDGVAAAASVDFRQLGETMATAADEVGGTGYGRGDAGEARFDTEETEETDTDATGATTPDASTTDQHPFTAAFREALRA
ncbi:exonuclease RecJ [Haloprofundus halobius]|uniref:exonuclease RecJ n=1 Tax=Haloprofundus halobius TaxID=2876194 RepID=UPI001CCB1D11|nr:exonuclease RecJ [Haloprofundus halobius]